MQGNSYGEGFAYRLNQHALKIQLAKQLFEYGPLVVLSGGLAGLAVAVKLLRGSWLRPALSITASPGLRHHLPNGVLARATVPEAYISVLVWANEALVLWLLVRLLAPSPITIPAAIAIYLLSCTAGMASSLQGGMGVNEGVTVLLLAQQGVPVAVALPTAVLRRVITLCSMVALAAAANILELFTGANAGESPSHGCSTSNTNPQRLCAGQHQRGGKGHLPGAGPAGL